MKPSERLSKLPPYLFADLDRQKSEVRALGKSIIDLSIGDPDLEPPRPLVDALKNALNERTVHKYPAYAGSADFRMAVAKWLSSRHGVKVNAEGETLALIGSKEGIAHLTLAMIDPGDVVLVPSPGYPAYSQATILAGGTVHFVPVTKETNYMPDFDAIPKGVLKKAKILFLNYPNNPTSALATRGCFEKAIELAREYGLLICHDAAYIEIHSAAEKPLSILSIPGAKDVALEFHSFSKTFCICGWRIGFVAGSKEAIKALGHFKSNMDSGVFTAIQRAMIYGMENLNDYIDGICSIYASRRLSFAQNLERTGFRVFNSNASFYIWAQIPGKTTSIEFCKKLLQKSRVAATPGVGFGPHGEGFVRFSLTSPTEQLEEAATRMAKL